MLISGIWAYLVLELLLIAGLYILYLGWRNRRLQNAVADDAAAEVSAEQRYIELLQKQILDADARLAQLDSQTDDPQSTSIVTARLEFLRAERKAIDNSGNDQEKFWADITEALTPVLAGAAAAAGDNDQTRLIHTLQTRLQAYETRVANLEQFRSNFFELKSKYAEAIGLGQQLHAEVGKALTEDQQSPELREAMEKLKQENQRLEGQLSLIEKEFDDIMRDLKTATDRSDLPPPKNGIASSMDTIGQGVATIRGVISTQEQRIQELTGLVSELKLEVSDKQRLEVMVAEFGNKQTELTGAISIIQEENNFLQEQISTLLKQELEDRGVSEQRVGVLEQELAAQRESYLALEKQFAAMEHEFLATYEENKRLKG